MNICSLYTQIHIRPACEGGSRKWKTVELDKLPEGD